MDEKIIYRPYRTHIIFAYMMIGISLISLVISGMLLRGAQSKEVLLFLLVGCSSVALAYYFFASSKVMIIFEVDGLRIINDRSTKYCFIPWKKISHGCYERNYKGHGFLVLSTDKLSKEQAKRLANKGAGSSKVCVEDAIVIYLDGVQDTSRIKCIVEQNISSMHDELSKKPENMT